MEKKKCPHYYVMLDMKTGKGKCPVCNEEVEPQGKAKRMQGFIHKINDAGDR